MESDKNQIQPVYAEEGGYVVSRNPISRREEKETAGAGHLDDTRAPSLSLLLFIPPLASP